VESTFFFPKESAAVRLNEPLKIGGAAFGGTRVARVELTSDRGKTWKEASIVKKMDANNVWVFWEAERVSPRPGTISSRPGPRMSAVAANPRTIRMPRTARISEPP
jgi:hypothetical protein